MAVTDQIKILNRKIMQNEAQYDLDRKAAKISALSSNILDKYEFLTGEDLGLKPSTVDQTKFEYSPLGKIFNKGLEEEDKKEGLLKRLKNIEDKTDKQLKAIEDQKEIQTIINSNNKIKPSLLKSIYSQEVKDGRINNDNAKKIFKTLEDMERSEINYSKLLYKSGDNKYFDFTRFWLLSSFYLKLINGDISINAAKLSIKEFKNKIDRLEKKKTKKEPYKKNKEDVLKNANALYNWLNIIVDAFEKQIFEYRGCPKIDVDYDLDAYNLTDKELQMFKKIFKYDNPNELRNASINADEKKYHELKNDIKITQNVLNKQIEAKTDVKRTRLKNLLHAVENVLNDVIGHDNGSINVEMPELESEESAAQRKNQRGQGLKIVTPNQMLSRFPITLAQLKAGNNSDKLKNEIRQMLYSL